MTSRTEDHVDQATKLRELAGDVLCEERRNRSSGVQVIAVTSGKGGVGKTNVVANLALAMAQTGKRVMVLDADLGLANLDVLLGLVPAYTLAHVLAGEKRLDEIILTGPAGVQILPASSGIQDLTALTSDQQQLLRDEFDRLAQDVDVLLIDTGAGISSNVLFFAVAAQEIMVVASPEPTSITDAYALMKVLSNRFSEKRFRLLVNMVRRREEGPEVYRKIGLVADRFLNISIDYVGAIPADDYVPMAVRRQRAVLDLFPQAPASREFQRLAGTVAQWRVAESPKGSVQFFLQSLISQG
ncbi:MAG: MinD/ParA family protein [Nitrospirae bacterium]|nr:MAG: MinD/ParA family protein [Nitrospirota bacterium]